MLLEVPLQLRERVLDLLEVRLQLLRAPSDVRHHPAAGLPRAELSVRARQRHVRPRGPAAVAFSQLRGAWAGIYAQAAACHLCPLPELRAVQPGLPLEALELPGELLHVRAAPGVRGLQQRTAGRLRPTPQRAHLEPHLLAPTPGPQRKPGGVPLQDPFHGGLDELRAAATRAQGVVEERVEGANDLGDRAGDRLMDGVLRALRVPRSHGAARVGLQLLQQGGHRASLLLLLSFLRARLLPTQPPQANGPVPCSKCAPRLRPRQRSPQVLPLAPCGFPRGHDHAHVRLRLFDHLQHLLP
mmetsp:Transcript_113203/g.365772  ORF Transcript_113203/g.365772 Transcript_113203/m.365772 type:complete len:299 (+) Transcript_113203:707-1603(+)